MSSWNVQDIVNSYSDSSDDSAKNWYEEAVNVPALIALLPEKNARVLDFGCGPGNLTKRLSKDYAVAGADAAANMIEKARSKFPGIDFFVWDGLGPLPEAYRPFDAIITKLTLEFIEDLPALATNLYTALRPGGTLVISVQHPLLAISVYPDKSIPYWGEPKFDVQIGTTGTRVTKVHRNLRDYTSPFLRAGFIIAQIDEPEIPADIAQLHNAHPIDLKFPKRLNLQLRRPN